ncbi:hypothetical protein ACJIZ3_011379 [Penstemon smallii]|uniref:Uncharacterized protein n=1 Tax=Penstemon smallii TaxID=265156 RepID=A0ABD3UJ54_9LAMI
MMLFPWKLDRALSEVESKNTRARLAVKLYNCIANKAEKGSRYGLCIEHGNLMVSIPDFDTIDINFDEILQRIMSSDVLGERINDQNFQLLEGKIPANNEYVQVHNNEDILNLLKLYTEIGQKYVDIRITTSEDSSAS